MGVILNGEALESTLVDVVGAGGLLMGVEAHGVGGGDPAEELAHRAVLGGPQDEVPVIRHQLVAEQLRWISLESFAENLLEGDVV